MSISESSTATVLLNAYRSKAISPVEIALAALARIDRLNPALNAMYIIDHEGALASAKASEQRWMQGKPCGLLDGIPTTAKDALSTKGYPIYRGAAVHNRANVISQDDAPCIARVKEHGGILLGKTTMPDFGMLASGYSSKHGITRNPWDLQRNPGGSSSGAAVTVAAGISPLVVGTDIVGSIRLPAAFCGLVGLNPTRGRVPFYFPNSSAVKAGPLARTVEDAALLMQVITEPDSRDFTALPPDGIDYLSMLDRDITGKRLGLLETIGFGPAADPMVLAAVRKAAEAFGALGCEVSPTITPYLSDDFRPAEDFYRVRVLTEMLQVQENLRANSKVIDDWTSPANNYSAAQLFLHEAAMMRLAEKAVRLLGDFDYLLLPTSPIPAFAAELPSPDPDDLFAPWCNTFLFNLADLPAISINCGFTPDGLPIGLQIVGKRFDDLGLLQMAFRYQNACPMECPWPLR